jgi:hypothetical protein
MFAVAWHGSWVTAITAGLSVPSMLSDAHEGAQMFVYEDNFGFWDIRDPEERIFFDHVPAPKCIDSLRALRTASQAHFAQGPMRFLCFRARIWRANFDERIWLQSRTASGPYSSDVKGASFPSSAALSVARR